MIIQNKKTGIKYPCTVEQWNEIQKQLDSNGNNMKKAFIVIDNSELTVEQEKIDIKKLIPETEEIDIKEPIEVAILKDDFNSEDYVIRDVEEFLKDKDIADYAEKFENDSRTGIKKLIYE